MRKLSLLLLGAVFGAGAVIIGAQMQSSSSGIAVAASGDIYRKLTLFGDIFEKVRSDYVEKPDESKLIDSAINGMLSSLDPHSSYLDPKSFKDMQVTTKGEFGGLGIEVTMEEGQLKVVYPIEDTPASRGGILAGDIIAKIDGAQVQGLALNAAVEKMRGIIGAPVTLTVQRGPNKEMIDIKLVRDTIRPQIVRARKEGDDIVYLRVSSFNEHTSENLKKNLEKITAEVGRDKVKGYVIDLRNNPGGLLDQAVSVTNTFLDRGEIVSTRGRTADETTRVTAKAQGDLTKGKPIIVMINGGSASASEIVAGALQDHKRATVIGTRSFGKGSVQTIIPLRENGALKLTTQLYYTPSGRSIQGQGVTPDMVILQDIPDDLKGKDETKGEASLKGHIEVNKGKEETGSSAYVPSDVTKDKQLIAALEVLRGTRKVEPKVVEVKQDKKAEVKPVQEKQVEPKAAEPEKKTPEKAPEADKKP
jgi:carboxyl-terminal processing protease